MSATDTKRATAATHFSGMNRSLDYELQTPPSLGQTEKKPAYAVALACLLLIWAVFSVATAILVAALLLPGHLGLSDLLQALGNLLPADASMCTTWMMIDPAGDRMKVARDFDQILHAALRAEEWFEVIVGKSMSQDGESSNNASSGFKLALERIDSPWKLPKSL